VVGQTRRKFTILGSTVRPGVGPASCRA
jgi:hypothetical protein